ncbi:multidrug efflux RND transporter permease subunit, partial [Neisseria meningitidis]|uniref:efflux RND transporter permease subunit n=1 Tax=Neisseria meningitidis TaxID=487 RepID=UPI000CBB7EB5
SLEWGGQSREEAKGGSQTLILYGLAVAGVFLVLAALCESWSIPLAVLLVIPFGLIGAAAVVTGRNLFEGLLGSVPSFANDIYFQVGFVTEMGLSAKNAILIIEFAQDLPAPGKSADEA